MESKLIFIHKHEVSLAYARKESDFYYLDGYYTYSKNDFYSIFDKETYFYLVCDSNCKLSLRNDDTKTFKATEPKEKMNKLKNYFDNYNEKVEKVALFDSSENIIKNKKYKEIQFYKLKSDFPDDNNIYIGTEEEKVEYFYSKFKESETLLKKNKINQTYEQNVKEKESLLEKINQLSKSKNDLQNNYNKLSEENDDMAKKIKELKEKNNQIQQIVDSRITFSNDENDEKETYDIVISILSMISLSKEGWQIKYPKGKEQYLEKAKKKTIIVGVIGNGNSGKSFILGKLSDYKIPQGFTIKTEGLSIRYGEREDHCVAILDSAGQQTPLLKAVIKENNKEKEKIKNKNQIDNEKEITFERTSRDKLVTETFIQRFIIEKSHILILVVGCITLDEQKLLERIKGILSNNPQKYLFVIHNLKNLNSKEQVDGYIENTLKKLFGVKMEEIDYQNIQQNWHKKYYVEEGNNKITHLIFMNDFSPIASYYNEPTITFLKKKLDVEQNRELFSVKDECKNYLCEIQSQFFDELIERKDFLDEEKDIILVDPKKEIKLKKVFIDEIGKTINSTDEPYHYYYTEGNYFFIGIELTGEGADIKTKLEKSEEYYIFNFIVKRPKTKEKENEAHLIEKNTKKSTETKFYIHFPLKNFVLLPNKKGKMNYDEKIYKDGVFTFKYNISIVQDDDEYE